MARREDRVVTACGCVTVPDALIQLPGETRAQCGMHGYQKIIRAYSLRESLGLPDLSLLDEPPFLSVSPHDLRGGKMSDMINPGLIPPRADPVPPVPDASAAYVTELIRRLETAHDFAFAHLAEVKDVLVKLRAQVM